MEAIVDWGNFGQGSPFDQEGRDQQNVGSAWVERYLGAAFNLARQSGDETWTRYALMDYIGFRMQNGR